MRIKKSVWTLFSLLTVGGFILVALLLVSRYEKIRQDAFDEHKYYTEIILNTTNTVMRQYESILELLGTQLLEHETYKKQKNIQARLDAVLSVNPSLVGLGLIGVNGNFLAVSRNINIAKMPNMNSDPRTKKTFKEAINADRMILGRTYYLKSLDTWVIPLRKSLRDKNGKVLGVMTTGLRLHAKDGFLEDINLKKKKIVVLVKDENSDNELYRQYHSRATEKKSDKVYDTKLDNYIYKEVSVALEETHDISLQELKENKIIETIITHDLWKTEIFAGIGYSQRFRLWVLVASPVNVAKEIFLKSFLIYISLYIFIIFGMFLLFRRIVKEEALRRSELLFQATHDSLTKLANRNYMYGNIESWKGSKEEEYYVLFIDLDNFKYINDNHGHKVGDDILVEVTRRLNAYFTQGEMIVRQGGDEFIVLSTKNDISSDKSYFQNIIPILSKVYHIGLLEFRVGASAGISEYPKDAKSLEALLSLSDIAMYQAKKNKNECVLFSKSMHDLQHRKVDIEHELRSALDRNEISMVYQPQIKSDGTLHGVEALVRWDNQKLGMVAPDEFISVAEDSGLMIGLGKYILERSFSEIHNLKQVAKIPFKLSINLSVKQLFEEDFLEHLLEQVEISQCDVSKITLEITESLFIEDMKYVLPILISIRNKGFGLSLDDFGTGFSSLSMLRELPISELKVDKSFVDDILVDEDDKILTKTIIDIGKNLNMETVAEGVEDFAQVEMLQLMKCDIFQGYYFSKPLSIDDLYQYIHNNHTS